MTSTVNVTQVRDNLAEILGRVKFGDEIVTVEKKGKPYAVIISPEEYTKYKEMAKKALMVSVLNMQSKNVNTNLDEVIKDTTEVVERVRQEKYERGK